MKVVLQMTLSRMTGHTGRIAYSILLPFMLIALALSGAGVSRAEQQEVPTFSLVSLTLPEARFGSVSWADYDLDRDLDLLLTGYYPGTGSIAWLYKQEGGTFVHSGLTLTGVHAGIAAWGDFDNDNDPDLVLSGYSSDANYMRISKLYRNDGGTFTELTDNFIDLGYSFVDWGDYDNDGDQDVVLIGEINNEARSKLYRNDAGVLVDSGMALISNGYGAMWGDYDNDGWLDLAVGGPFIYHNNNGQLVPLDPVGPTIVGGTLSWVDIDSDRDLDLAVTGNAASDDMTTSILEYGANGFTPQDTGLPGIFSGGMAWGDYDGDGDPDVTLAGYPGGGAGFIGKLYRNEARQLSLATSFTGMQSAAAAWGDYDGDADLDMVLAGENTSQKTLLYRNNATASATVPLTPTGLMERASGADVVLSWADSVGPCCRTYNLRVGTTPGGSDIVSSLAHPDGQRMVQEHGNMGYRQEYRLSGLEAGRTYYWSVQAVGSTLVGSPFAVERSFTPPLSPSYYYAYVPLLSLEP